MKNNTIQTIMMTSLLFLTTLSIVASPLHVIHCPSANEIHVINEKRDDTNWTWIGFTNNALKLTGRFYYHVTPQNFNALIFVQKQGLMLCQYRGNDGNYYDIGTKEPFLTACHLNRNDADDQTPTCEGSNCGLVCN